MKNLSHSVTRTPFPFARTAALSLALLFGQQAIAAPSYPTTAEPSERERLYLSVKNDLAAQDYQAAVVKLQGLIEIDSEDADAFNLLGYSHRKMKRYNEAERYYKQALALDPEHRGALNYAGQLYQETGRFEQAQEMLSRLNKACLLGCAEYRELKGIIDRGEATAGRTDSTW